MKVFMVVSDDLFQLIKSLSKSEKRHFALFIKDSKDGQNKNYALLFSLIEEMKDYDEEKVKVFFAGKPTVKHFHVAKKYLYDLILKTLRLYYDNKRVDFKLFNLLKNYEILQNRGLYNQGLKVLRQAKKLAIAHDRLLILIEIYKQLILEALKTKNLSKNVEKLYAEFEELINQIELEFQYERTMHQLFIQYRSRLILRSEAEKEAFEKAFFEKINKLNLPNSFRGKIAFYYSHALFYRIGNKNLNKANDYYRKIVEIWRAYPKIQKEHPKTYKLYLSNYLNSCHTIKKYDEFDAIIKEIKLIPFDTVDAEIEHFQNIQFLQVLKFLNTANLKNKTLLEEAQKLVSKIEHNFEKFQDKINSARKISFQINISILFFILEDYISCQIWLNKLIRGNSVKLREDMQTFAKILYLIVLYELNEKHYLKSLLTSRSLEIGLKNKERLYDFEKLVLSHLKKINKLSDDKKKLVALRKFETSLNELKVQLFPSTPVGFEEVLIWVKSKANNESFLQTLEKFKSSS